MTGIGFLIGIIGFVVVAHWAYTNDRLKTGAGERGLLAMKNAAEAEGAHGRSPRWRTRLERTGPTAKRRELPARNRPFQRRLTDRQGS
jgi:hypothetical protein